jgi:magnesium chelatase family protein
MSSYPVACCDGDVLVHAHGFTLDRGTAQHVHVELDARGGLPTFSVIGIAGAAARDIRERVQAAILNSGFAFPRRRLTANLTPPVGSHGAPTLDLALACCVLAAQEDLDAQRLMRVGLLAKLGLGGDLRPGGFGAAAADAAASAGLAALVVAPGDLVDAQATSALTVLGRSGLREVSSLLATPTPLRHPPMAQRGHPKPAGGAANGPAEQPLAVRAR